MTTTKVDPDVVDPDVTPYPSDDTGDGDEALHSLPSAEEVKHLQEFVEGEKRKSKRSSCFDLGLSRKQMFVLGSLACILFIIIIAMGAAMGQSSASTKSSSREREVVNFLSDNFADRTALEENDSPQKKAARWIADEDTLDMPIPTGSNYEIAYKFVQRYALAVLYFALGGENQWIFDYQFLSDRDECDWNYQLIDGQDSYDLGVMCNQDKEVDYLFIPGNGLKGTVPGEIGLLLALSHLSLYNNNLDGNLPIQMMYLTDMHFLALEENQLSGSIPEWLGQLTSLKFLALGSNKLTGTIPTSLTAMTLLSELSLEANSLTGGIDVLAEIPTLTRIYLGDNSFEGEIGHTFFLDMPNIVELDLSSNQFTGYIPHHFLEYVILDLHDNDLGGEIPSIDSEDYPIQYMLLQNNRFTGQLHNSIAYLSSLTHLDVSNNQLNSSIPQSIEDMFQLQSLYLANNDWDEGPIPRWDNLTDLVELSLKGTNRVGPIQPWIGRELRGLTLLSLDNNNLSGEIPQTLGHMEQLEYLLLNQNNLTGTVPDTLKYLHNLKMVRIDGNMLSGDASAICTNVPEQLDIFTSDCTSVDFGCKCCTNCCDDPNSSCAETKLPDNDVSWNHGYPQNQAIFSENIAFGNFGNRTR